MSEEEIKAEIKRLKAELKEIRGPVSERIKKKFRNFIKRGKEKWNKYLSVYSLNKEFRKKIEKLEKELKELREERE